MSLTQDTEEEPPEELSPDELLERVAAMDSDRVPIADTAQAALEQRQDEEDDDA